MSEDKKYTILVVEDDQGVQNLYKNILEKAGYFVGVASNYQETLDALQKQIFDVALIDVILDNEKNQNRDGLRILGEISKMEKGPLGILSTGHTGEIDEQSRKYAYSIFDKKNLNNRDVFLKLISDAVSAKRSLQLSPLAIRDSLNRITNQMARQKMQLDSVCKLVLDEMLELVGAEAGNLFIVKENELQAKATAHGNTLLQSLSVEDSISGLAIRRYQTVYVPDLKNSEIGKLYKPGLTIEAQSELAIPAIMGIEPIAVLNFESPRINAFDKVTIELLEKEFAPTVAIVIHDAILQQSLIDQAKHVIQLSDISKGLNSTVQKGENKVAEIILEKMIDFLKCQKAAIFTVKEQDNEQLYILLANRGLSEDYKEKSQRIVLSSPRAYTARTGLPIFINDIEDDNDIKFLSETNFVRTMAREENYRSIQEQPLQIQGKTIGSIVAYYTDCRHFKDGSEELALAQMFADHAAIALDNAKQYQELQVATNRQKLAAIGELSGDIVHRMNSPLGAIRANLEIICDDYKEILNDKPDLEEIVKHLQSLTEGAIHMVREMREKARGQVLKNIDVVATVNIALKETKIPKTIKVDNHLESLYPIIIRANPNLSKVFKNLIGNACDAMPEGGKLILDSQRSSGHIDITIQDTGVGISDDFRDEIFDILSVFSKKRKDGGGHGLGLWYCRAYVEACGGELPTPESSVGHGSKFTVRFPLVVE